MVNSIFIENQEHWHELRKNFIGSSDIACLFGMSMFKSKFTLWHEKAGNFKQNISSNRIFAGNHMEDAIRHMVNDKTGLDFEQYGQFYINENLGATPDFMSNEHENTVLEVKNMDYLQYKSKCINDVPPYQYILQLQHQMHCTGYKKGILAIFVGGNDLRLFNYDYRKSLGDIMQQKASEFFKSIEDNNPPSIDSPSDLEVVKEVFNYDNRHIDFSDSEVLQLCEDLKEASEKRKYYENIEKLSKAKLLDKMSDYNTANVSGLFNLRATQIKENKGNEITQDMVGTFINSRKPSIRLTLKETQND